MLSILGVDEFFARALAIEMEAAERYDLLADQMEAHNNRAIAEIFRKMARIEGRHHDKIAGMAEDASTDPRRARMSWTGSCGPEAVDFEALHYLMTPRQALQLARAAEARAVAFFETVEANAADRKVKALAADVAEEERQHVIWVDRWLQQFPPTGDGWDEDPDPPVYSE